jgi:hypothetical protein
MAPIKRFRLSAVAAAVLAGSFACDSPSSPKTGDLSVTVSGLPAGTDAQITVVGPGGISQAVTHTGTLSNLNPGTYTITAADVTADEIYRATAASQTIQLSNAQASVTVSYHAATGTLNLAAAGLPSALTPVFDITGPQNFSASVTGPRAISRLTPGDYSVVARVVADKTDQYSATNSPLSLTVTAGATVAATVQYALRPATINLRIDGAYVTQSVQRYDGSVPLVAGRTGYLRIFAVANEPGAATPAVRVRLYTNGALVSTRILQPKTSGLPLTADEGSNDSWLTQIDGSLIQQGFGFVVDVDPDNLIKEINESDNSFPVNGSPRVPLVQSVPSLDVRFVPIVTSVNGLTGVVNDANKDSYLETALRMYPLSTYSAEVRAPFTTSAAIGPGPNELSALNQLLNEIDALRIAEGSPKYYAGIVKLGSGSSFSGVAVIGQPTSVSYDLAPGAPVALAHEFGHTAGRRHAPCGNPANPDSNYPYVGANIGTYGFDATTQTIYLPASTFDLMSYCSPRWLSDYTYVGVMNFRNGQLSSRLGATVSGDVKDELVVWGRVENGRMILEPAFTTRTSAPSPTSGSYRAEGFDENGSRLFVVSFEPTAVADAEADTKEFAIAIPLAAAQAAELTTIRVVGEGKTAQRNAAPQEILPRDASAITFAGSASIQSATSLSWRRDVYPLAVIRDADSGTILAFGRNGHTTIATHGARLDVMLTDGVRSVRGSLQPATQQ